MKTATRLPLVLLAVALAGVSFLGCSSSDDSGTGEIVEVELPVGADADGDADVDGVTATVVFDGEELVFDEVHCNEVPGEGEMRFMGLFEGGELVVDETGGPDGTSTIRVSGVGDSDYTNIDSSPFTFENGSVDAEIEVTNLDEESATVVLDITCS